MYDIAVFLNMPGTQKSTRAQPFLGYSTGCIGLLMKDLNTYLYIYKSYCMRVYSLPFNLCLKQFLLELWLQPFL
jgi:hypothetical protein